MMQSITNNLPRHFFVRSQSVVSAARSNIYKRQLGAVSTAVLSYNQQARKNANVSAALGTLAVAAVVANYSDNDGKAKCSATDAIHVDSQPLGFLLAHNDEFSLSSEPHPKMSIDQVLAQPEDIARALGFGSRLSRGRVRLGGLSSYIEQMSNACDTSLNAAQYATKLVGQMGSFDGGKGMNESGCDVREMPVVANNKMEEGLVPSGKENDLISLAKTATEKDTDAILDSSTTHSRSFATQVTVLALVALWFRQTRDMIGGRSNPNTETLKLEEALTRLPISFGMTKKSREQCKNAAKRINGQKRCIVSGKGYAEPVAIEGASSIEEISNMHAKVNKGELEVNDETDAAVILIIMDDENASYMRKMAQVAKAKGQDVIVITDRHDLADGLDKDPIVLQHNGPLTALGAVLPLQLIAYELASLKGINSDAAEC